MPRATAHTLLCPKLPFPVSRLTLVSCTDLPKMQTLTPLKCGAAGAPRWTAQLLSPRGNLTRRSISTIRVVIYLQAAPYNASRNSAHAALPQAAFSRVSFNPGFLIFPFDTFV